LTRQDLRFETYSRRIHTVQFIRFTAGDEEHANRPTDLR
jgi:hypothetical protein